MDRAKLDEYSKAVNELKLAVAALTRDAPDWNAAHERVREAEKRCASLRHELYGPQQPRDLTQK